MLQQWIEIIADWPDLALLISDSGRVLACSEAFSEWSGWSSANLEGTTAHDVLCAPARDFAHDAQHCPFSHAAERDCESLIVHRRGAYLSAHIFVRPLKLGEGCFQLVRFVDDSEIKHTFYELNRMSYFVDRSPFPLAEFNAQGLLEYSNPAMTKLMSETGYDDDGQLLVLPDQFNKVITEVVENPSAVEVRQALLPNGDVWSWMFYHFVAEDEDRVHGIATNITERLRRQEIEADLERIAEEIKEDTRKKELAKLTHELRSPLNSIVGFASILKSKLHGRLSEQEASFLDLIEQGGLKLAEQISESLGAVRAQIADKNLNVSRFSADALCDEMITQVMPLAAKRHLKLNYECDEMELETDRSKLAQILINFLDNAIKYTEKGSVSLVAKPIEDYYEFSVIDTGRGLGERELEHIFDAFHRATGVENIQGTGLGLSVVKELSRRLQADVAVDSVLGKGSRFYIRLPI